jgi:hypothetical protein
MFPPFSIIMDINEIHDSSHSLTGEVLLAFLLLALVFRDTRGIVLAPCKCEHILL